MDASLSTQLALAALVCSVAALFFSLLAAFPGLKLVLAAIRDAVLWLTLVLVLGGVGYVLWQERQLPPAAAASAPRQADLAAPQPVAAWPVLRGGPSAVPAPEPGLSPAVEPALRVPSSPAAK